MNFSNVLTLLGGLGMFLYGMTLMGDGLEKAAGDRLQKIIDVLTANPFKGMLMGAFVTSIIQSSSATTVMVVGFVNAGIMNLNQAVGVIMGANIGTTMTAWLLSLGDLSNSTWFFALLKPKTLAPILLSIGIVLIMMKSKKKNITSVGEILTGFGLLFIGMYTMEGSVSSLSELPQFKSAFLSFQNPIIGVLVGAGITAIIQSSSASVGILQASAAVGLVTFSSAVPIVMGQNIGTCITALLSSIGANKNAKKAAMIHLFFNIIGTIVIMSLVYIINYTIGIPFWNSVIGRVGIAQFHTSFNVINTILLMPFSAVLVKLANLAVRGTDNSKKTQHLEERFLSTPTIALSQAIKEIIIMANIAKDNVRLTAEHLINKNKLEHDKIIENEDTIDNMEVEITNYLGKIVEESLTTEDNRAVTGLFHIINDIERIGDHSINITYIIQELNRKKIQFTDEAIKELEKMYECTFKIMDLAITSYQNSDIERAQKIEPLEEVIDELNERLRSRHIDRLTNQKCTVQAGLLFIEILSNLERIADHCSNIGVATVMQYGKDNIKNSHKYLHNIHNNNDDYKENYEKYLKRYEV